MTSVDRVQMYAEIKKRGFAPMNMEALAIAVRDSVVYRFRRSRSTSYQYEVVLPGYGKSPKKSNWADWSVIR